MIPYNSTPVLFNFSQNNSSPPSGCNSKRSSINCNQTHLKQKSNSFSSSKDSEWLTLEICREYLRGDCLRDEYSCRYAHPGKNIETQNGRVVCCYDYLKCKCYRQKPPCKYLHPPIHLKEQLLQKGKTNLMMKNLQFSIISNHQGPASISRPQSALPYNLDGGVGDSYMHVRQQNMPYLHQIEMHHHHQTSLHPDKHRCSNKSITSPGNLSQSHNLKSAVQIPIRNMQTISYAAPPVPYVIIPQMDSHNIQYTHMAIESSQVDSKKSTFINPLQTCPGGGGAISTAQTSIISPYQSFQQQYSFMKTYCIPYQPVMFKNWPLYTFGRRSKYQSSNRMVGCGQLKDLENP